MTMTHHLTSIASRPGNQVKWTCACGKTGHCGPGMPSTLHRLVQSAFTSHRARAQRETSTTKEEA